jgi:ATP-binding cassette, subfamily B, multidrug efflux pump
MNLGFIMNTFSQSKASGERLLEVLDEPLELDGEDTETNSVRLDGEITFENVTHRYKNEKKDALKDVSLTVKQGHTIGLIGATGSGKTSITQLLSRFYKPVSGRILIDGKPLENYSLHTLRKNIGTVLQESFLFSSTIRDNISYGNPDADMDDIVDAAKRAQAHDFIMELPDGYDTILGERGLGLSGGQKQRISIARAILIDPAILILDDATSAVDMETEFMIQKALKEVMDDRTTFIIAHRISSLKHADEILVLHEGAVVERGTHEELIQKEAGNYRRVYDIQYQDRNKVFQNNGQGV